MDKTNSQSQNALPDPLPHEPLLINEHFDQIKSSPSQSVKQPLPHIVPPEAPVAPKASFTLPPKPPVAPQPHVSLPKPEIHISEKSQNGLLVLTAIGAIILAVLAAFGVNQLLQRMNPAKPTTTIKTSSNVPTKTSLTPVVSSSSAQPLVVNTFSNGSVIKGQQVTVAGMATPLATVVGFTSSGVSTIKAASDGTYTLPLPVTPGINKVSLVAFDQQNNESEKALYLVNDATQDTNTKLFFGKVMSKSANALTVADGDSNRQLQVTINAQTKVAKSGKTATLSDIVVGSMVAVVAGAPSASDVVIPTGLVLYDSATEQSGITGTITGVNNNIITLLQATPKERYFSLMPGAQGTLFGTDTKPITQAGLARGNKAFVVGTIGEFDEVKLLGLVVLP